MLLLSVSVISISRTLKQRYSVACIVIAVRNASGLWVSGMSLKHWKQKLADLQLQTAVRSRSSNWFIGRNMHTGVMVVGSFAGLDRDRQAAIKSAVVGPTSLPTSRSPVRERSAAGWLVGLVSQPHMVVTQGLGVVALFAGLYRMVSRRATLLVFLAEPPRRMRFVERLILRAADGVLVDGEAVAQALVQSASPARAVARIAHRRSLDGFLGMSPNRAPHLARRMVVVSQLTPESGAADFLIGVIAWAEAHPDQRVELSWVGEGDLAGLLAAQPLPGNLFQMFLGSRTTDQLATIFEFSGFLVVPSVTGDLRSPVPEALAAGLPVLGSLKSRDVLPFITDEVNGWLFDPLTQGGLFSALSRAMATDDLRLNDMRSRARASVCAQPSAMLPTRMSQDVAVGGSLNPEYQRAP